MAPCEKGAAHAHPVIVTDVGVATSYPIPPGTKSPDRGISWRSVDDILGAVTDARFPSRGSPGTPRSHGHEPRGAGHQPRNRRHACRGRIPVSRDRRRVVGGRRFCSRKSGGSFGPSWRGSHLLRPASSSLSPLTGGISVRGSSRPGHEAGSRPGPFDPAARLPPPPTQPVHAPFTGTT